MTNRRPTRQTNMRRPGSRASGHASRVTRRRTPLGWRGWLVTALTTLILVLLAWAALARRFASRGNTLLNRFDVIIVLGTPADDDGNPTPALLARVSEGVHEYERGVAPRLIMTGGAAHNRFVEGRVMARTAHAKGIPESAIYVEPEARDTIQNACYAVRMMRAHGWRSAEVISEAPHLPRAGLIFSRLPLEWRTHAAPAPQPESGIYSAAFTALETLKTVRYLVWAHHRERCEP